MKQKTNYFSINIDFLPKNIVVFPFHLYLYDLNKKCYRLFLECNSPLTIKKNILLKNLINSNNTLCIPSNQKETFHAFTKNKYDITPLNIIRLDKRNINRLIRKTIAQNNFEYLIKLTRKCIENYSSYSYESVLLAKNFTNKFYKHDNKNNRVISLSIIMAYYFDIYSPSLICDLFCASLLKNSINIIKDPLDKYHHLQIGIMTVSHLKEVDIIKHTNIVSLIKTYFIIHELFPESLAKMSEENIFMASILIFFEEMTGRLCLENFNNPDKYLDFSKLHLSKTKFTDIIYYTLLSMLK